MKKRIFVFLLIGLLILSISGCGKEDVTTGGEDLGFKIGLVTGTVSQGEEEFRAGENLVAKYGKDVIKHITYPDKFSQEQETTIAQIVSLSTDEDVKAIVICQAVPGTAPAIDKIRETRDDILFIAGEPHEDPDTIASRADIILSPDQLKRGSFIINTAHEMGAKTFVHYSFPRHMSMELLSQRRDIMKNACDELGIEFVEIDAPDPTGDAGIPGTQQFILEDVPRQVEEYGKDTAFFGTNCAMQEPLIKSVLDQGAIYPEQCCPSPYHAYPGALGLEIPEDKAGDIDYMIEQIKEKIAEKNGTGRFGTWKYPANMTWIEAGVEYAIRYGKGEIEKFDKDAMLSALQNIAGDTVEMEAIDKDKENFFMIIMDSQIF
ncbi:DUF3798 domain-containing protein [Schnuerera sp.]|uniref:DUF3798 domain-containing protein n=1 Tax=Schnuerera sp. TaxID=2794844 RepID=UPI002CD78FEE|nr:DUF3798 domain-containing protein [Schnuerera sp.]HSH36986.1 DUF3798 domain-containing protein [Schnuerera sp.]